MNVLKSKLPQSHSDYLTGLMLVILLTLGQAPALFSQCPGGISCQPTTVELPCLDDLTCAVTITPEMLLPSYDCLDNIQLYVGTPSTPDYDVTFDLSNHGLSDYVYAIDTVSGYTCGSYVRILLPNEHDNFTLFVQHETTSSGNEILYIKPIGFRNIRSAKFSLQWNPAAFELNTASLNYIYFRQNHFDISQVSQGILHIDWVTDNLNGLTLANFSRLLELRFKDVDDTGDAFTEINFIPENFEFITTDNQTLPAAFINGSLTHTSNPDLLPLQIAEGTALPNDCTTPNAIEIIPFGGTTPYSFAWTGPDGFTSINQNPNNLTTGIYHVTVTDAADDTTTAFFEIAETGVTDFLVEPNFLPAFCETATDGTIEILSVKYGVAPYQFLWSNGATTQHLENVAAGEYSVTITDAIGCSQRFDYALGHYHFNRFDIDLAKENAACNGVPNGMIELEEDANFQLADHTWQWSTGDTTVVVDNLSAGMYAITVTETETGCVAQDSIRLNQGPNNVNTIILNYICGTDMLVARHGPNYDEADPITFNWNNGVTHLVDDPDGDGWYYDTLFNPAQGYYHLTVIDNDGCQNNSNWHEYTCSDNDGINNCFQLMALDKTAIANSQICIPITYNPLNLAIEAFDFTVEWEENVLDFQSIDYYGFNNYLNLSHFDTTNVAIGQLGFSFDEAFSNNGDNYPNTSDIRFEICYDVIGETGETSLIEFTESIHPFKLEMQHQTFTSFSTKNGLFTVTNQPTDNVYWNACVGFDGCDNNSIEIEDFDYPVNFQWTGSQGFTSDQQHLTDLIPGTYHLVVTDLEDNYVTSGDVWITYDRPASIAASTVVNEDCPHTGSIHLSMEGGSGDFAYSWNNGATTRNLNHLESGLYIVTITDDFGCTPFILVDSFMVEGGNFVDYEIAIETICATANENDGAALIHFIHPMTQDTFTREHFNLTMDFYTWTVNDQDGCPHEVTYQIFEMDLTITPSVNTCLDSGTSTGSITLITSGDDDNLVYQWSNGSTDKHIYNLPEGDYTVQILDTITLCQNEQTFEIRDMGVLHETIFCETSAGNNGAISIVVHNPSYPNIDYAWSTGFDDPYHPNLPAGNYEITVTENDLCEQVTSFEVPYSTLEFTGYEVDCAFENGSGGAIDVSFTGGSAPFEFEWSGTSSNTEDVTNLFGGFHQLTITESTGCQVLSDMIEVCEMDNPDDCVIFEIDQAVGNPGDTVLIPVLVHDFNNILSFQYSIVWNADDLELVDIAEGAPEYLEDVEFNTNNIDFVVTSWFPDNVVAVTLPDSTAIFALRFKIIGETEQGSPIQFSENPTVIEVTNGFEIELNFTGIPGGVTIGDGSNQALAIYSGCNDVVNCLEPISTGGSIAIFPKGGLPPYQFNWSGPNDFANDFQNIDQLAAGTYTLTLTDDAGNTMVDSFEIVTVGSPDLIDTLTTNLHLCPDENTITAFPNNPSQTLNYLWHNNQTTPTITATNAALNTVTVTDENGCTSVDSLFFDEMLDLNLTATPDCTPDFGKTYTLHTTLPEGGLLNVIWSDGVTIATNNNETTREDVPPGTYFATISNSAGCIINTNTLELPGIVATSPDTLVCGATAVPLSVTTIGSLDSYEWSPATGLSCLDCPNPTALPEVSTTYTLTAHFANDTCAEVRQIFVAVDDECVWPGDANYNDIANHFDLLPIGLGYDETGPIRPNATTNWQAEPAFPYANQTPQSLVNYKHADTDGNGWIDANDTLAIILNWDETHNLWGVDDKFWEGGSVSNSVFTPDFYIEQDTAYEGEGVALKIMLGTEENPAEDVYGLAFSVSFDENLVAPGSAKVSFETSWLGDITDDMIAVQRQYVLNGHVNVGVTRIDHENRTGFGQIGTCYIVIEDNIFEPPLLGDEKSGEATEMELLVLRGVIIDNEENELIAFYPPSKLIILEQPTSVFETELAQQIALFPNPVQAELTLNSPYLKMQQLTIFDWSGKMMQQTVIDDFFKNIDVERLAAGAYFIKIQTAEGFVFKRFVKE